MRSLRRFLLPLALVVLVAGGGCLTPLLLASSVEPVAGRAYERIGPTEAESCIQSILGIPISTDASLHTTLAQAKARVGADNLVEVTVDRYSLVTGFYNQTCTVVHAWGIRYTDATAPFLKPVPAVPAVPAMPAPPAPPAQPAVEEAPVQPPPTVKPAPAPTEKKKLTRAERRRLAAEEKRRAREEAKQKAAEEKRLAAEAEARKKAEAVAAKQAEEDAKLKAEVEARLKAEAETKRKAEEEARRKAAEASKPVPAEFDMYCKYNPGQQVSVETKAEKIEAAFLGCRHKGMRVKRADKDEEIIPFGVIWSVRMLAPPPSGPAAPRQ